MSIVLYRPGDQRSINGIKCESQVFNEYSYLHLLKDGWFYSPNDFNKKISDTEIRKEAKKANIGNWHNKKIDNLKKELSDGQS